MLIPRNLVLTDTAPTLSTTRYNMLETRNPRIFINQVYLKFFFFFFTYMLLQTHLCNCIDTMKMSDQFLDTQGDSLESSSGVFRLGFFALDTKRYVGVWYLMDVKAVVWVANRENPILDDSGVLRFDVKGSLVLSSQQDQSVWSIDPDNDNIGYRKNMTRKLQLLDTGNLVISEESQDGVIGILWESFENPTNTFLPGMKMKQGMQLSSWKGPVDPAPGDFTFLLQEQLEGQYMIQNKSFTYWISGVSEDFSNESNDVPYAISALLSNTTKNNVTAFSRVRILSNGTIQHLTMDNETTSSWNLLWFEPSNPCRIFDVCGDYGICNSENRVKCRCLPGFEPEEPDNWNSGQFSEGCRRNSSICDGSATRFLELNMMRFGKQQGGIKVEVANESICKDKCLDGCKCEAYSYIGNQSDGSSCWIWSKKLNNVQEYVDNNGYNLNIRAVLLPESKWKCEPCGTNIIPYPLSIDKNCGDPAYSGFICNRSSGQVYVGSPPNLYRITGIDETIRKFYIQVDTSACPTSILKLNMSQFRISYCSTSQSEQSKNVEIEWRLPKEPPCNSTEDCSDWSNTVCNIDGHGSKRCFCKRKFKWDSSKSTCAAWSGILKLRYLVFLIALPILTTIICCIIIYMRKRQANRKSLPYDNKKRTKGWINSIDLGEEDNTDINKLYFNISDILKATNNFSNQNKLGQGGFGPVYKGILPGGEEIAVKRLLSDSGQGLQELKNEVMLIAKLQHRNLVRLLGYCIEGDEKLLLYEYMPNKSLDAFLFDRTRCILLTWDLRKEIILGIARGMLYLHQDSRLRIIHRDLKPSNILLDEDMNPKISDFGLARIFQGKQTEASTKRVIGTYGYMSPEYALEGYFSVKSDVYSYGVVVLEIISGRQNTSFYNPEREGPLNLISYAWSLWKEDDAIGLLDQTILETCNKEEVVKYLKLALLCVQDDPSDRPTMSSIVFTLGNDNVTLPSPRQPAFVTKRSVSSKASSLDEPGTSLEISTSLELNIQLS